MDFNDALDPAPIAIYAMNEQAHHESPAAPPTGAKRSADSTLELDTRLKKPRIYDTLPGEVILEVARYLPLDHIPEFSRVNRHTYALMEERRWAWRCYQQADSVSDLASLQQLIGEIEQIQVEPDLRAEPLTALWKRSQSMELSPAHKIEVFKLLFAAADRLPEQGLPLQRTMLASMDKLSRGVRLLMFDFAYTMAEQHRLDQANFWSELAQALPQVTPSSEYHKRYQALLNRLAYLNTPQKAELIPLLAERLQFNRRIDPEGSKALSAHIFLQQQTLLLPPSLQGASIGMLAAATEELPAAMRVARYAEMRQLALSLPDEQLGVALREILFGLVHLPSEHRAHEFQLLEPALLRVLPEQRVQVARGLLEWALLLGNKFSKQVWRHALLLLDGRGATELLEALGKVRVSLRTPEWQDAVNEVTAFMDCNRFTEQTRATIDARMLHLLHPEDRMTP
jgi:hypothetical protein